MNFPDLFDNAPVVRMYDPLAQLMGSTIDGVMDYRYADAVRLMGHSCPTVAGAFLIARAALKALYPDELPERGRIAVHMPSEESEGTTGVVAQVLTLVTGAAATSGFRGIGGRHARNGLLTFASDNGEHSENTDNDRAVRFQRLDTGTAVSVIFDAIHGPADEAQRERMQAVIQNRETFEQRAEFAQYWQSVVSRMLLEHADDPVMIRVIPQG